MQAWLFHPESQTGHGIDVFFSFILFPRNSRNTGLQTSVFLTGSNPKPQFRCIISRHALTPLSRLHSSRVRATARPIYTPNPLSSITCETRTGAGDVKFDAHAWAFQGEVETWWLAAPPWHWHRKPWSATVGPMDPLLCACKAAEGGRNWGGSLVWFINILILVSFCHSTACFCVLRLHRPNKTLLVEGMDKCQNVVMQQQLVNYVNSMYINIFIHLHPNITNDNNRDLNTIVGDVGVSLTEYPVMWGMLLLQHIIWLCGVWGRVIFNICVVFVVYVCVVSH